MRLIPEQIEAGRLDGAKGGRMLWHIILPQLRPCDLSSPFVVTVIGALRSSFDLISVMTNGGPLRREHACWHSTCIEQLRLSEYGYPHGLWCCDRSGAVPDHAHLHFLLPLEDG